MTMGVLSNLSQLLERLTDEYVEACDRAAEAENAAERAELRAFAKLRDEGQAVAAAEKLARLAALDERAASRLAAVAEKTLKRKIESVEKRLNAAQSHTKFVREQT